MSGLFERDGELKRIEEVLAATARGQGATLLVEGAAGIGKTALLGAVRELAASRGVRVLSATGADLEREYAFGIVRQLLEPVLRRADRQQRQELFAGAATLAEPVLMERADGTAGTLGGILYGLFWACVNLADHAPLLLTVDDVHWADEASLRFISYLARRTLDLPVLLLLAALPISNTDSDLVVGSALAGLRLETLRPNTLSTEAVGELVREQLSPDADDEFCRACAHASGGNPFLLAEALNALRADDVRPAAAETGRLDTLRAENISRALLVRLARLGPDAARMARAVTVLGPDAMLWHATSLASLEETRAASAVDALVREGILVPGQPLTIVHPLIRTAIYSDTDRSQRALAHKRAARLLQAGMAPAERIGTHLLNCEPANDQWVVAGLRAAAAEALARGAPEPAAVLLERALGEPPVAEARSGLLLEAGLALRMANRADRAAAVMREALELTTDPSARTEIALSLGALMTMLGRGNEAVAILGRVRSSGLRDEPNLSRRLLVGIALADLLAGQSVESWLDRLDQLTARGIAGETEDRVAQATVAFAAAAVADRSAAQVARLASDAAAGLLPAGRQHARDRFIIVSLAGPALAIADRLDPALALFATGIEAAQRDGDAAEFAYLSIMRSHTALYAGRILDAEADARIALDIHTDRDGQTPLAVAVLIDALVDKGAVEDAQALLTSRQLDGPVPLDMLAAHFFHVARGRLRLRQHRPRNALTDLRLCGESLITSGYTNPGFAHWRAEAALAHHALGEHDEARRLAEEELDRSRQFGAARALGIALRITGLVTDDRQRRLEQLRESVAVLETSPARLERARSRIEYGAALRRTHARNEAKEQLRLGLDLATRCSARPLATQAREELRALGVRTRSAAVDGPAALTGSERRVALLAVGGLTNGEIAQALFVSRRAVEQHLTNTYRKLRIDSRHALAEALGEEDPDLGLSPSGLS
ncbi:AAA family ATPase [Frankia sp. AgPm24]|uniref:ATP-binding protein n=1 Tax=Frankia sp. AgPm24 TaxID=631128 RepID=UPI00200E4537|nr:LuxR family transcriptional regulator [Frankia sp. AgPm24]MCK9925142.1 AAA family ATPase [Frankia sp. AgPm24]